MEREYQQGIKNDVTIFVGTEIEHTPAYGKKTLFVVGIHPADKLEEIARWHCCDHIYLGANHSYNPVDYDTISSWELMCLNLLDKNFFVTLDIDSKYYDQSLDLLTYLSERNMFIPLISVKLPYITNLNYNACIKVDDKDFKFSNPGVWVHQVHDLMDRNCYTSWDKYGKDEIIE